MTPADIDRRKALIVACLCPTRVKRGFKTEADCDRLATLLGISRSTLTRWENGDIIVPDDQVPSIERWLASGTVWRYDRIDHVIGPESWPEPLHMTFEMAPQGRVAASKKAINVRAATDPASGVGV